MNYKCLKTQQLRMGYMQSAVLESVGWLGFMLLALCGVLQLLTTIKTKTFDGLSISFIIVWFIGEIFAFIYVVAKGFSFSLLFNYGVNIIVCVWILVIYIQHLKRTKK